MPQRYSPKEIERVFRIIAEDVGLDRLMVMMEKVSRALDNGDRSATKYNRTLKSSRSIIHETSRAFSSMLGPLNSVIGLFAVGGLSYQGIIKYNYELNRSLLSLGRQFSKYGAGIVLTEQRIESFATKNRMLRTEVIGLASAYEKAFIAGGPNFEGFLKMLQITVGNNSQAMQDYAQQIYSIGQEYIGFQRIIRSVNPSGELTESQKILTEAFIDFGEASGRVSIQHRKNLQDMLAAQDRFSDGGELSIDKDRRTELEQQIDAVRTIEKTVEDISVSMNSRLMPVLEKIADFIGGVDNFGKMAADIVLVSIAAGGMVKILSMAGSTAAMAGAAISRFTATSVAMRNAQLATATVASSAPQMAVAGWNVAGSSIAGSGISNAASTTATAVASSASTSALSAWGGRMAVNGKAVGARIGMSIGRAIPIGMAAAATSYGSGWAYDAIYESATGGERAYDSVGGTAGKAATMLGAGAATGAAIGSIFGGVGAAPGAVIGTAASAIVLFADAAANARTDLAASRVEAEKISQVFLEMYKQELSAANTRTEQIVAQRKIEIEELRQALDAQQQDDAGLWNQILATGFGSRDPASSDRARALQSEIDAKRAQLQQFLNRADREGDVRDISAAEEQNRQTQTETFEIARQNNESQNQYLQDRIGLYNTIIGQVGLVGDLSENGLNIAEGQLDNVRQQIDAARQLNQEVMNRQQELVNSGEANLNRFDEAAARERPELERRLADLRVQINDGELALASGLHDEEGLRTTLQEQRVEELNIQGKLLAIDSGREALLKAYLEAQSGLVQNQSKYAALVQQTVEAERSLAKIVDPSIQRAEASANLIQARISLADNLAMGLAASADLRMEAVRGIGEVINLERQKLAINEERIAEAQERLQNASTESSRKEAEAVLLALTTDRLNMETGILNKQQQQASMLRALRDGYISSINAMNTGAGVFTKIIIDQNRNMGTLLRSTGSVPVALRTGSDVGGFRTSERFTPTGIASSAERRAFPMVRPEWEAAMDSRVGFSGLGQSATLSEIADSVSDRIVERVGSMSGEAAGAGANYSNISRLFGGGRSTRSEVGLPQSNKKEIVDTLTREIGKLILDAVSAAKEDIMSEISNGIG